MYCLGMFDLAGLYVLSPDYTRQLMKQTPPKLSRCRAFVGHGIAALVIVQFLGCTDVNVNPIQGKVTLGGKPFQGLLVYMRPIDQAANMRSVGIGETDANGTLHLRSSVGEGLDRGTYRVSFSLTKSSNHVAAGSSDEKLENVNPATVKEWVPHPFSSGEESTVTFEVKSGENRFEFDIPPQ
jgi:hypothetical protein